MNRSITRRDFNKICTAAGGLALYPSTVMGRPHAPKRYSDLPKEYDIFAPIKPPKNLFRLALSHMTALSKSRDRKTSWLLNAVATIFQGLVNRTEPRLYLTYDRDDVDWLGCYRGDGYSFACEDADDFRALLDQFKSSLDGYIVFDLDRLDTLNVAQTWGSLENWMVVTGEMEPLVREVGLEKRQDLRGRWSGRVEAYEWAFKNLFARCSKHIVGAQCIHFPHHPSGDATIRDFLVCNKAFTFDLSAAFRQRREYRLFSKICAGLEFPSGVWGWHCARDHEHWAVARAARESGYTICALGMPNLSVHGGFKARTDAVPVQKRSPRKNRVAEKGKVYVAFMMTDGDSLWAMHSMQVRNWGEHRQGAFPMSWGFLPLLADIAPAMYLHYVKTMKPRDYMVAGPSGAGYTYPHLHEKPRKFLRYSKHYMQRCSLDIVYITNWNDDTNWQEVDTSWFNPLLFEEMDNCIGFVRGMGESAFGPHYNFSDKPYIFSGEGIHLRDKDDVATLRKFIEANPNRPLFVYCQANVAVRLERIQKIVNELKEFDVEYVRLDDFMRLIRSAHEQGLIKQELYPNRSGNERILIDEAPVQWAGTKHKIEGLIPVLHAKTDQEALRKLNADRVKLALGQEITDEDKADVLAFALCESMFALVKNVLNLKGIYVNRKMGSVDKFLDLYGHWEGAGVLRHLTQLWKDWDQTKIDWAATIRAGRDFVNVFRKADKLFPVGKL